MTVYLVKQQGELDDCGKYPLPTEKWFSDEIDAIAAAENIGIIDLHQPWLEFCLEKTKITANEYYYNNIHPNALGADILAQMVNEQLFPSKKSGEPVSNPHKGFVMTLYNPDMLYEGKYPYGIDGFMGNQAWNVVKICSGVMFWEDINPQEGVYNWEEIDRALEACEHAGITYGIRIIPYTTSTGLDENYGIEHDFVPQCVYDKGARQNIATYRTCTRIFQY